MSTTHPSRFRCWIEAMRLRTLPVSVAGVVLGCGLAVADGSFCPVPAALCLGFALLAQIASNFGNEYFDYRDGLDAPGRDGPRRGVTEGDISPRAMLIATFATLAAAAAIGCCLIPFAGWWLLPLGIVIALAAMAYSTGPYPLSRHCLGEVTVVAFFGVIPVCLTYFLQTRGLPGSVVAASFGAGLLGANVLIINNVRDRKSDKAVGKITRAVKLGRPLTLFLYLIEGVAGSLLLLPALLDLGGLWWLIAVGCCFDVIRLWLKILPLKGPAFNPMLGRTAMLLLTASVLFTFAAIIS